MFRGKQFEETFEEAQQRKPNLVQPEERPKFSSDKFCRRWVVVGRVLSLNIQPVHFMVLTIKSICFIKYDTNEIKIILKKINSF